MNHDPNGFDWDARCRDCGRVDQSCKCDWPMPVCESAPSLPVPVGLGDLRDSDVAKNVGSSVAPGCTHTGAPTKTSVGEDDA